MKSQQWTIGFVLVIAVSMFSVTFALSNSVSSPSGNIGHTILSNIVISEGKAYLSFDTSRKDTELKGMEDAQRKAIEKTSTRITGTSTVIDARLESNIRKAYIDSAVKVIEVIKESWEPSKQGEMYRIQIKAEVIPNKIELDKALEKSDTKQEAANSLLINNPIAPLYVQLWTTTTNYHENQKIKIYLKGNKPFFARLVYAQADGTKVLLIPNPYRKENYFQGQTVYEVPGGLDQFELKVQPPFGAEAIILYASTEQLGAIDIQTEEAVSLVNESSKSLGLKSRGVAVKHKSGEKPNALSAFSEFNETVIEIKTGK